MSENSELSVDAAVGNIGLVCAVGVAVILGIHPFGSTELYDDGAQYLEHVSAFWIVIHLAATPLLFGFPLVIWRWGSGLADATGRALGLLATIVAIAGVAVGALHLVATDTVTFFAFTDTFEAAGGSEAVTVGADVLLRIHAATLVAWILSFWFLVPAVIAGALAADGARPAWMTGIAAISALCQLASLILFFQAAQHTTASETGVFRIGVTLLIGLIGVMAWELRRGAAIGQPASRSSAETTA